MELGRPRGAERAAVQRRAADAGPGEFPLHVAAHHLDLLAQEPGAVRVAPLGEPAGFEGEDRQGRLEAVGERPGPVAGALDQRVLPVEQTVESSASGCISVGKPPPIRVERPDRIAPMRLRMVLSGERPTCAWTAAPAKSATAIATSAFRRSSSKASERAWSS